MVQTARATTAPPSSFGMSLSMLALTVALMAAVAGVSRFAYAAALPMMQRSLGLSYVELGVFASVSFLGYIATSFATGFAARRFGFRRTVGVPALVVAVGLIAIGLVSSLPLATAIHLLVGAASAFSMNMPVAVSAAWFAPKRRGLAVGITAGGTGLGLLLLGGIVAVAGAFDAAIAWRLVWVISGLVVLVVGLLALAFLRASPAEVGLSPFGLGAVPVREQAQTGLSLPWFAYLMPGLSFPYGILLASYYTFFKPFLLDVRGLPDGDVNALWAIVGSMAAFSAFFWGMASDRIGKLLTITVVLATQAASVFAVMLFPTSALGLAAFLFGLVSGGLYPPSVAVAAIWYGPRGLPTFLGVIATFYGIGLFLGPIVGGAIAQATGTVGNALLFGAYSALIGAAGGIFLILSIGDAGRRPGREPGPSAR